MTNSKEYKVFFCIKQREKKTFRIHISVTRLNTFISKWSALLYVQNTLHVVMNYQPFLKPRWKWTQNIQECWSFLYENLNVSNDRIFFTCRFMW